MPKPVLLYQDGAIDELLSVALLTTMPTTEIDYLGCFIVNGDCLAWPTVQAQVKLLRYMSSLDPSLPTDTFVMPVACRAVNAFPWTYRQYSMMSNLLPALNELPEPELERPRGRHPREHRRAAIAKVEAILADSSDQLTLLSLGPLTPIADLVDALGSKLVDRVEELVWMGGAIPPTTGNIDTGIAIGANPHAEWNAYWDPYAVDTVFRSGMTVKIFPLDVTNLYPLDTRFFERYIFPNQAWPMIDLAGQMYSTVAFETGYCFWDTVTTAYLGKPDLFSFETLHLVIETDFTSPDFGSIRESADGSPIQVAKQAEKVESFYDYYVAQLKSVGEAGHVGEGREEHPRR